MNRQRQRNTHAVQHQRGAVAIIVALCLTLLVGMLGLVLDLGHLYVAKTELQNAADAAALSGAERLNGTADRICCAADSAQVLAIEAARRNSYDLNSKEVAITAANLWVGNCPDQDRPSEPDTDGCTMVPISTVTSDALAVGKTFLQVDTDPAPAGLGRSLSTWFIQVLPGVASTMQTFGMAVAGHYTIQITPLGVCAISLTKTATNPVTNELLEFGFRRGVAYNIPDLNPLGASGVPMWINPVDAFPGSCDPSHASASFTAPFVCTGNTATITALPQKVYVSTGTSASLEKALNSRFDKFTGSPCDPASAPPDSNKREYRCSENSNPEDCGQTSETNLPKDWMDPANITTPTQQTISLVPGGSGRLVPVATPTFLQYGALWSYSRAVNGALVPFNASNSDWALLYNGGTIDTSAGGYPDPADSSMSPYKKGNLAGSGNKYFEGPSASHTGKANRRVLTLAIMDCDSLVGAGLSCSHIDVVGLGKFFMQVPADFGGSSKRIQGEFSGLIPQLPPADIKLYR